MSQALPSPARVAIACGGTGGHLFPGLAVAGHLQQRGCSVTLLISPKDVDQRAVREVTGMEILTIPAVGLSFTAGFAFLRGFARSYCLSRRHFRKGPPQAALAMGGFTSAPPLLAAKLSGALTFLHESNSIPGRANRWLSWMVDRAFVGFPSAAARLRSKNVLTTGTPVRPQFKPRPAAECRAALGLEPTRPVLLVMGGSQGASGVNDLALRTLPRLSPQVPELQWLHITGMAEQGKVEAAYRSAGVKALVRPFLNEMELAFGAATVAVTRAGASSLAELAAMQLPAILIPYPSATNNHQLHNARAFEATGAALVLEQRLASPETLARLLLELLRDEEARKRMQHALGQRHVPRAAEDIARHILAAVRMQASRLSGSTPQLKANEPGGPEQPRMQTLAPAFEAQVAPGPSQLRPIADSPTSCPTS